jgi:hypothetical protein
MQAGPRQSNVSRSSISAPACLAPCAALHALRIVSISCSSTADYVSTDRNALPTQIAAMAKRAGALAGLGQCGGKSIEPRLDACNVYSGETENEPIGNSVLDDVLRHRPRTSRHMRQR